MISIVRRITVLTLLVAFGLTGLLPAVGSWSCPDGTVCVYTQGRGYHCLGDQCHMACCAAQKPAHGCGRCEHGAVPSVTASSGSARRTIGEPARCRYHEAPQAATAWFEARTAPDLQWQVIAILPAPLELPHLARLWKRLAPTRGSPPLTHLTPSSSPRAPPGPDCA